MFQVVTRVKLVLKLIEKQIRQAMGRRPSNDDTVEEQAQTFKIWMWSSAAGLALILIGSAVSMASKPEVPREAASPEISFLEKIPEGFVLAPIEPVNFDSLDSVFEQHGFADLYRPADGMAETSKRGRRIARGLPLIRAPRNPKRFAVVVAENDIATLAELSEPIVVVLRKGPAKRNEFTDSGTGAATKKSSRKRREKFLIRDAPTVEIFEESFAETWSENLAADGGDR